MQPPPVEFELRALRGAARASDVLELADQLDRLTRPTSLLSRIEAMTGLRLGELEALLAVSEGADHARAVARATRQADTAAAATVQALQERALVGRHHHPAAAACLSEARMLHVTERGRIVVAQVEAIRIRMAEALVLALGEHRTRAIRASIEQLAGVLEEPGAIRAAPP
ncbi:hypothetical protein [Pseudonocardia sp. NPDC049154]|uniref:hypothetical protein n=1 Tax=Pseudonocardia sp. NPDC049154 TaxID=3155501 RepID=UPI00340D2B5A